MLKGHGSGAADAQVAGVWCGMAMGWGQLMLMMLLRNGHGQMAMGPWGRPWVRAAWHSVWNFHGVGAADAHDAGVWCGMAMG